MFRKLIGFPSDSRYSNGNKLCLSSSRHISLLIWRRIYTVFALNREENVGVSVQFHIQVHRWCFVHKEPRVWELPGPNIPLNSRSKTRQRATLCFLPGFTSVDREVRSLHTSISDKCDDFSFHIIKFLFMSSNIPTSPAYGVFMSHLIRYARACSSYGCFILRAMRLSNKLLEKGYAKERYKIVIEEYKKRKFHGRYGDLIKQYEVSLSQILTDILWTDHIQWQPPTDKTLYRTRPFTEFWEVSTEHLQRMWHVDRDAYSSGHLVLSLLELAFVLLVETSDILYWLDTITVCDIIPGLDIITESDISPNIGFHIASATGVAYQQGTLTPPDTWSRPFGICICSTCWDQSFFRTCRYFYVLCSSNIPRYFLDFAPHPECWYNNNE